MCVQQNLRSLLRLYKYLRTISRQTQTGFAASVIHRLPAPKGDCGWKWRVFVTKMCCLVWSCLAIRFSENNGLPQLSRLENDRIVRGQFCLPYGNLVRSRDKTGFPRFT